VVITGGKKTLTRVSRYEESGWVSDMPSLNQGRVHHGCTAFMSDGQQVLMVTGGSVGVYSNNFLDSTELLRPDSGWQEITARLPRQMSGVRVNTVDNRVILSGGFDEDTATKLQDYNTATDILEYTHGDGWRKIGTLRDGRGFHGTSLVEFKDFERYCN